MVAAELPCAKVIKAVIQKGGNQRRDSGSINPDLLMCKSQV